MSTLSVVFNLALYGAAVWILYTAYYTTRVANDPRVTDAISGFEADEPADQSPVENQLRGFQSMMRQRVIFAYFAAAVVAFYPTVAFVRAFLGS